MDGIAVTLKRIADDIPMEVVSKDPSWSKIVEDLNNRNPATQIEDLMHELHRHHAIIFGSPTRFGNIAPPIRGLWDMTSDLWMKDSLIGKVGAVFTNAASVHGGQETTAISMMFPMLHHDMIIVGVPYFVLELIGSGSPYGPSRIVGSLSAKKVEEADIKVAQALGKRVAEKSRKLSS